MYLCVWAIFRAPRVLPALACHVQPLGLLTMPTAQSEPWGRQLLPQWLCSSRTSVQHAQIWAQSLPTQGWGCTHPSLLGQQDSPWVPHPAWRCSREPLLGQLPAQGHCHHLRCPAAFSMAWCLSSSTPQAKSPGMSLMKCKRGVRCSNVI